MAVHERDPGAMPRVLTLREAAALLELVEPATPADAHLAERARSLVREMAAMRACRPSRALDDVADPIGQPLAKHHRMGADVGAALLPVLARRPSGPTPMRCRLAPASSGRRAVQPFTTTTCSSAPHSGWSHISQSEHCGTHGCRELSVTSWRRCAVPWWAWALLGWVVVSVPFGLVLGAVAAAAKKQEQVWRNRLGQITDPGRSGAVRAASRYGDVSDVKQSSIA